MTIAQRHFEDGWVPDDRWGYRCYQVRKERHMTVKDIAKLCDVKPSTWSSWENGGTPQKQTQIAWRIAARTNCDRDWLAYGTDTQNWKWMISDGEQLPIVWEPALANAA